jgi:bifunctional DNase/RNase
VTETIPLHIEGVRHSGWRAGFYDIALLDDASRRLLNVTIFKPEAYALVMAREHVTPPRPTTIHLMAHMLDALGATLVEARIERVERSPIPFFFASVWLRGDGREQRLDARPSDALALAALLRGRISAEAGLLAALGTTLADGETPELLHARQVLAHASITLPPDRSLRLGYRKRPAADAVVKEVKASQLGLPEPVSERDFLRARQAYIDFVLGPDAPGAHEASDPA